MISRRDITTFTIYSLNPFNGLRGLCDRSVASTEKIMITQRLKIRQNNLPHWQQGGCVYYITFRSIRERLTESALDRIKDVILHDHNRKYRLYITVIMPDHVHMFVSSIPDISPAQLIQVVKSITARKTFERFPGIRRMLWGGALWERDYFVMSSGTGTTDEMIRKYIKEQTNHANDMPNLFG